VGLAMLMRPRWKHDRDWRCNGPRRFRGRRGHHGGWGRWDPEGYKKYYEDRYNRYNNQWQQPQEPNAAANPQDSGTSSGPIPPSQGAVDNNEDFIDSVSVFGGVRKVIMSKNFRGGEATSFMGGTELDFSQADINGVVVLELTQVMGGAKLIVPGHWSIRNEVNAVLGGVDDKRQLNVTADPNKTLVLKGTSFLGGLEISNF
ncbi:MAG: hypothetical protein JST39_04255, partial [Bacteroidetes bacterium]|nr:hypothetical protein [Bacteroidota bacterium]